MFEQTFNYSSTRTPSLAQSSQSDPLHNHQNNVLFLVSIETEEPSTSNAISNVFDNENLLQITQDESLVRGIIHQVDQRNNIDAQNGLLTENTDTETAPEAVDSVTNAKTEPVLVIEPPESNRKELEALLNDEEVVDELCDDMVIKYKKNVGFGKPFACNTDGLIKYENDIVSGNMPYKANVRNIFSLYLTLFI